MNGKSRLSEALDAHPDVLEYIISLNPHDFARLRSPILRKVMPPRITLARVATIAGIPEQQLLDKVHAITGLSSAASASATTESLPQSPKEPPVWFQTADQSKIKWVDVTPIDAELGDPMPPINIAVNTSKPGDVIGIKHKWEPQPLFDIWHTRGLQFYSQQVEPDLWHIFVWRPDS